MSRNIACVAFFAVLTLGLFSQRPAIELNFSAVDNTVYIPTESIKIMNLTQESDTVIYWPDTVLLIDITGISDLSNLSNDFQVFQNYPNPVTEQTAISLFVPSKDIVCITVTDITGRLILQFDKILDRGLHSFRFTPGNGKMYFFTATWKGNNSSLKIINLSANGKASSLDYLGSETEAPVFKASVNIQEFKFTPGDELLYIGYSDTLQSGLLDSPGESTTYTFQFATNIPCPGTPTVEYEGQVYNTIQIFSQCWLKENLNVGGMIDGTMEQSNNGTIEKYCYNNEPDSCTKYGGLYQWHEMMQYDTQQVVQGICPPGWHLPTDVEWMVLEGSVDSLYGIGNNVWSEFGYRGTNAGANLKAASGWTDNGNGTDLYGFSCLPGGVRIYGGDFGLIGSFGFYWSSSGDNNGNFWNRLFDYGFPTVDRIYSIAEGGQSVRCLRDY